MLELGRGSAGVGTPTCMQEGTRRGSGSRRGGWLKREHGCCCPWERGACSGGSTCTRLADRRPGSHLGLARPLHTQPLALGMQTAGSQRGWQAVSSTVHQPTREGANCRQGSSRGGGGTNSGGCPPGTERPSAAGSAPLPLPGMCSKGDLHKEMSQRGTRMFNIEMRASREAVVSQAHMQD